MRAGKLDTKIKIYAITESTDAYGGPTESFDTYIERFASVEPLTERELYRDGMRETNATTRFVVRYDSETAAITNKDRIIVGSTQYDVVSTGPVGPRGTQINILAAEHVGETVSP